MYLFILRYCPSWKNNFSSPQVHPRSAYRSRTFCLFQGASKLKHILGSPKATLRMAVKKGKLRLISLVFTPDSRLVLAGPVVTDNGNFIIDAPFDREKMIDPYIVSNFSCLSHPKILNEYVDNVTD